MHLHFLITGLALVAGLQAQHVVPAPGATTDGNAVGDVGGIGSPMRTQVLIDSSHLQTVQGQTLTGLWLRRDKAVEIALAGGDTRLRLTLSTTTRPAHAPAMVFTHNHGTAPLVVFDGVVPVPTSPVVPEQGYEPWASQNTVRITFQTPFFYGGGNLCLELTGEPVAGERFWPVDHHRQELEGDIAVLGTACGLESRGQAATGFPSSLALGGTATFLGFARPGCSQVFMLGTATAPGGLDLSLIGLSGCHLFVDPAVSLPQAGEPPLHVGGPGHVRTHVPVPVLPSLAGAPFVVQYARVEWSLPGTQWSNPMGITLSNGVVARLSAQLPSLGISRVSAPITDMQNLPVSGLIEVARGPVLRFVHL